MSKASLSLLDLAGVTPYQPKKDEEYMNEDQILHFRKILTAWHEQIVEEASRTVPICKMKRQTSQIQQTVRPKKKNSVLNYVTAIANVN